MNPHRQTDHISDLPPGRDWFLMMTNGLAVAAAIFFVVAIYSLAAHADTVDANKAEAWARAEQARIAMPAQVAQAYERGLTDAIEALRDTPDGVALAQACMARGGVR
jgi:hypothetical protein